MATRKENIDIEYDEPQQEVSPGAVESNSPYESQDPAGWMPPMTVRIYPISRPRSKLLATANVNIAKSFAVQGFRRFHLTLSPLPKESSTAAEGCPPRP